MPLCRPTSLVFTPVRQQDHVGLVCRHARLPDALPAYLELEMCCRAVLGKGPLHVWPRIVLNVAVHDIGVAEQLSGGPYQRALLDDVVYVANSLILTGGSGVTCAAVCH